MSCKTPSALKACHVMGFLLLLWGRELEELKGHQDQEIPITLLDRPHFSVYNQ